MIDTRILYYLVAVYENKTLSDAANKLHISQQALGKSIRKLEEELHVSLFNRTKNKIEFNEYGLMCVDYAKKIISELEDMKKVIQAKEKQNRTISIGSLAPRPLNDLYQLINQEFSNIHYESEVCSSKEDLIKGLYNEEFQLIILDEKLEDENVICHLWGSEELYFSLPSNHVLINKETLSFEDLDGQTMLLYKNIGFWKERVLKNMPHTHFIIENNRHDFLKLLDHSDFVCFTTDLAMEEEGILKNRVIKEIGNPEALVPFYICCLAKNNKKYKCLFK